MAVNRVGLPHALLSGAGLRERTAALAAWAWGLSPETVLMVSFAGGFVIRPSPLWAMLYYLTVLPLCGGRLATRRRAWPTDAGSIAAIALMGWFTLATLWDVAAGLHPGPHIFWIWNGLCTLVMFAASRTAFGAQGINRERLISTLIFGALANLVIVFARTAFAGIPDGRLTGWAETRHPILGAAMIGTCVLLAAGRLLAGRRRRLEAVVALAGIAFIVLTGSRGPLLAIGLSLGLLMLLLQPRLLVSAMVACGFGAAMVEFADPDLLESAWSRMMERGWSNRLDIWRLAVQEIESRPWLGYGPSTNLDRATDNFPHDLFLSTLFYSGIVGLALLLVVLALATLASLRQPDGLRRATGLALLLHLVVSGLTDLSQITKGPGPLWFIIWVPIILALGPPRRVPNTGQMFGPPHDLHDTERSGA
jgi:O-antigen ligase